MRLLSPSHLDPAVERELDAIDAALAGRSVPDELGDLEALVHEVRAARPSPSEPFVRELDRRAADGFGRNRPGRRSPRASAFLRRRTLMPALGAVASLLLAAVVAVSVLHRGRPDSAQPLSTHKGTATVAEPLPEAGRGGGQDESVPAPVPPSVAGGELPGRRDRRVEREASLTLTAPADKIAEIADDVVRVTDRVGGIVVSSNVETGDRGRATATFDLRVPTPRLREALSQLSELAHVKSRTQSSQDVTGSFVSSQERLREVLAERQSLLRQLADADTLNETESLRARLRIVNTEIAARRGELAGLRERTSFSRLSVTLESESSDETGDDGTWTPSDALHDAIRILEVAAGIALVTLAVIAPLALLGVFAGWGVRRARRRRREQALDAS